MVAVSLATLAALLLLAPLSRSGQLPVAGLVLQWLALGLLITSLWERDKIPLRRIEIWGLTLLLLYPLVYLIPIPAALVGLFPGRDLYLATDDLFGSDVTRGFVQLALVPAETQAAWLFLLVPVAVYVGTRLLDPRGAERFVWLLLAIAALQAALGLMQYGAGAGPLYFGLDHAHGNAVGTFTNRNHLAGLLAMTLPLALALLVYSVGQRPRDRGNHWKERILFLGSLRGHVAVGYAAIVLLLILAVVFTRSRAGIALTMLGILLATFAYARRLGGTNVYGLTGTLVTAAIGLGLVIGLAPVLDRFTVTGAIEDARWTINAATLEGIRHFLPFGSGPGGYAEVFPAYQPVELGRYFINHAHNDYLQWLFEGGLLAALLMLFFAVLYLRQWSRVWTPGAWTRMRFIQVAAGIGLLLGALHSLVEFHLHIPANLIYFAFLAGLFFSDLSHVEERTAARRRRRRTPDLDSDTRSPSLSAVPRPTPPPDQIRNPFLD